jgi:hypothetical protein
MMRITKKYTAIDQNNIFRGKKINDTFTISLSQPIGKVKA